MYYAQLVSPAHRHPVRVRGYAAGRSGNHGNDSGTVTDSTGASIPGANVQVKNVGTGQTTNSQTDAQGRYRIPDIGVGDYEVQASKDGFATLLHKGIGLTVGSQNVVDFSLAIGQQTQTVTVEGAVTQVETTNSTVASLVNQTQMRELPLNGRNFEQLIQLAPVFRTITRATRRSAPAWAPIRAKAEIPPFPWRGAVRKGSIT